VIDKTYYSTMLKKGRLIPFIVGDKLIGFVSFYITNDVNKYLRDDPWTVLDDEPEIGKIAYIEQVWTNKAAHKYSFEIWKKLKQFLKTNYPLVEEIHWKRWRNNKLKEYRKENLQCTL